MGNIKRRLLRVDWVKTVSALVRIKVTQIQRYSEEYNLGDFDNDDDIPNVRAVRTIAGETFPQPIIVDAPTSGTSFDYAYDGSLGENPTAYLQLRISDPSDGWVYWNAAKILDNGNIYAEADFGIGDVYRLVIKA